MRFARKPRRQPFINIISLIDILVVLLIFYIVTTVFKKSEPKLNIMVPSSTTAKSSQDTPPSTIYASEDKVYLDDQPVDPDKLGELLQSRLAADPNFKVALRADAKTPFNLITKVLDAANVAHITNLQMYTAPPASAGGTSP